MRIDSITAFYLLGFFLAGATVHTMLAMVMSPVVGGVLIFAIAVPFSVYVFSVEA